MSTSAKAGKSHLGGDNRVTKIAQCLDKVQAVQAVQDPTVSPSDPISPEDENEIFSNVILPGSGCVENCPFDLLYQFLENVILQDFKKAQDLCRKILKYEPDNKIAHEFLHVLALALDEEKGGESDAGSGSEEDEDDSDSDSEEDRDSTYSTGEENENEDQGQGQGGHGLELVPFQSQDNNNNGTEGPDFNSERDRLFEQFLNSMGIGISGEDLLGSYLYEMKIKTKTKADASGESSDSESSSSDSDSSSNEDSDTSSSSEDSEDESSDNEEEEKHSDSDSSNDE